jgi:hypothetical protein
MSYAIPIFSPLFPLDPLDPDAPGDGDLELLLQPASSIAEAAMPATAAVR